MFDHICRSLPTALAAGLCIAAATAPAQTTSELRVQSLAASCAGCHGTDGRPAAGSSMPRLAGVARDVISTRMRAFRDGSQPATVMQQIARGYDLEQIDQLARYFSAQAQ